MGQSIGPRQPCPAAPGSEAPNGSRKDASYVSIGTPLAQSTSTTAAPSDHWTSKLQPDPGPSGGRVSTGSTITDWYSLIEEDGRAYQGYMPGAYSLPNDGAEQERLDLQHCLWLLMLHGKLGAAPIRNPRYVLDIGTGTGIWALQFSQQYPDAHVIGTDLSMIQPIPKSNRCQFFLENSETAEWFFDNPFDYIHIRSMAPCFYDIMTVIQKAYRNMAPGGWIELNDASYELQSMDGTTTGTAIETFMQKLVIGGARLGQDTIKARFYNDYLVSAGFQDVTEEILPCPLGLWPLDAEEKRLGRFCLEALRFVGENYRKFLLAAGLSAEEIPMLIEQAILDTKNTDIHGFYEVHFVYGRKPYLHETAPA